ncbi:MAG TPA: hypothetical protein VJ385_23270 [Fibrobacteria bacterium]|nr:hypothetical protein [Fibrobacteria bacterium]
MTGVDSIRIGVIMVGEILHAMEKFACLLALALALGQVEAKDRDTVFYRKSHAPDPAYLEMLKNEAKQRANDEEETKRNKERETSQLGSSAPVAPTDPSGVLRGPQNPLVGSVKESLDFKFSKLKGLSHFEERTKQVGKTAAFAASPAFSDFIDLGERFLIHSLVSDASGQVGQFFVYDEDGSLVFKVTDGNFAVQSASMSKTKELLLSVNVAIPSADGAHITQIGILYGPTGLEKHRIPFVGDKMAISANGDYALVSGMRFGEGLLGEFKVVHLGTSITDVDVKLPSNSTNFTAQFVSDYRIAYIDFNAEIPTAYLLDLEKGGAVIATKPLRSTSGKPFQFNPHEVEAKPDMENTGMFFLGIDPDKEDPRQTSNALFHLKPDLGLEYFSEGSRINSYSISKGGIVVNQWKSGWRRSNPAKSTAENVFELAHLESGMKVTSRAPNTGSRVMHSLAVDSNLILDFEDDLAGSVIWNRSTGARRTHTKELIFARNKKGFFVSRNKATGVYEMKKGSPL